MTKAKSTKIQRNLDTGSLPPSNSRLHRPL